MVYSFNKKQQAILVQLGFNPFEDYDDEDIDLMIDAVSSHLMEYGFRAEHVTNEIGIACEDIITKLTRNLEPGT